jgi:cell wall-associated NlpC family hydrolase
MRRLALLSCVVAVVLATGTVGAQAAAYSWATPQIKAVVAAGLMAPSVAEFRPDDPLTQIELATVLAGLGMPMIVTSPYSSVTVRELDARLVAAVGLRAEASAIRLEANRVGLKPKSWLGTETVARLLGLRLNHLMKNDDRELQLSEPATRAEAAYSLARVLSLESWTYDSVVAGASTFVLPELDTWQQAILQRALRFVGSPYVFAGTSERPQTLFGKTLPGGFDCSGFVWRVYKLERFAGAPELADVLKGRTTYAMSGEVPRSARIARASLEPGDVVFFGARGPRSKPAEVGHVGIYVGNGWMVHSSDRGTTLTPMTGWYETRFAWGRRPLAEAGIAS